MKNTCSWKDTFKRMKRQVTEWEKILAEHVSVEGLSIYKGYSKINNKTNGSMKKWKRDLNRHCTKHI